MSCKWHGQAEGIYKYSQQISKLTYVSYIDSGIRAISILEGQKWSNIIYSEPFH